MTRIIVDFATTEMLAGLPGPVELCDERGRVLGEFRPAAHRSIYLDVDAPLTKAELDRREQETGGYTTEEVLERLKNL
jgi:hypothetical protein